jgi:hypothetical protein
MQMQYKHKMRETVVVVQLSAEFTAFRRGVEEAGATAFQVMQLQAKVQALEASRAELEAGLPALRAAAEGNMAALAAAQEKAEQQRKEARASAIKCVTCFVGLMLPIGFSVSTCSLPQPFSSLCLCRFSCLPGGEPICPVR